MIDWNDKKTAEWALDLMKSMAERDELIRSEKSSNEDVKNLLESIGGDRKELSKAIGIEYTSATNQLAKGKEPPKWAKSMLYMARKLNIKYEKTVKCIECNDSGLEWSDFLEEHVGKCKSCTPWRKESGI